MMIGRRALIAAAPALAASRAFAQATPGATSILDFIPRDQHDAVRRGTARLDCGPALTRAIAAAPGAVHLPAGTYPIETPVRPAPGRFFGRYSPAPVLLGDGPSRTILANRVMRGAMIDIDAGATAASGFRSWHGLRIEDLTIDGANSADGAIRLRTVHLGRLARLHIIGHRGTGIRIPCTLGDTDGSNMISFEQLRIENCGGWGLDTAGDPGSNENSFFALDQVFVQNCGTAGTAPFPASGGMRHKGQVLTIRQSGFAINQNVGLWLPGQAGLGSGVLIEATAFENNIGRHLYCTGYDSVRAVNIQFYSSDPYRARVACECSGANYMMRGIDIDGVTVRATKGNSPFTVFRFGGENLDPALVRVAGVVLENFGFPGQTLVEGPVPVLSDNRQRDNRQ